MRDVIRVRNLGGLNCELARSCHARGYHNLSVCAVPDTSKTKEGGLVRALARGQPGAEAEAVVAEPPNRWPTDMAPVMIWVTIGMQQ